MRTAIGVHAYRIDAIPLGAWPPERTNGVRGKMRALGQTFGHDPLPKQAFAFDLLIDIEGNEVLFQIIRFPVKLSEEEVSRHIKDLLVAENFDSWELRYHLCQNGAHLPCEPWRLIDNG